MLSTSVVINTASTISLDAIALDKPVVNIAFDIQQKDYYRSVRQYFNWIHVQHIVKSGATKLAGSLDELVFHVQRYLGNPELEREERARFTEIMCYRVDGKSAERIASLLLDALDGKLLGEEGITAGRR